MTPKVNVVTTVSAWPDALQVQRCLLNKYSRDSFSFIAVIDTSPKANPWNLWDPELREKAREVANIYCDEVIMMPEELHFDRQRIFPNTKISKARYSNERASDVLQYVFQKKILNSVTPCLIIDSDMFPISSFSVLDSLSSKSFRGVTQSRSGRFNRFIEYYWNGILMFDPPHLEYLEEYSFDCGKVRGLRVDTGGQSFWWRKKMVEAGLGVKLGFIEHLSSLSWELNDYEGFMPEAIKSFIENDDRNQGKRLYCEIYDNTFLHFRAGSNWREESAEVVQNRNSKFLKSCLQQ